IAGRRTLVTALRYSADGKTLAAGGIDGVVQAWSTADGSRLALTSGPKGRVLSFAFPADKEIIALGMLGQSAVWWDAVSGKSTATTEGHQAPVLAVAYAPDGKTLTSISFDGDRK